MYIEIIDYVIIIRIEEIGINSGIPGIIKVIKGLDFSLNMQYKVTETDYLTPELQKKNQRF